MAMPPSGQADQPGACVDPRVAGGGARDVRRENALSCSDIEDRLVGTRIQKVQYRGDRQRSVVMAAPASDPAVIPAGNVIPACVSRSASPSGTLLVPGHGGRVPWCSGLQRSADGRRSSVCRSGHDMHDAYRPAASQLEGAERTRAAARARARATLSDALAPVPRSALACPRRFTGCRTRHGGGSRAGTHRPRRGLSAPGQGSGSSPSGTRAHATRSDRSGRRPRLPGRRR